MEGYKGIQHCKDFIAMIFFFHGEKVTEVNSFSV